MQRQERPAAKEKGKPSVFPIRQAPPSSTRERTRRRWRETLRLEFVGGIEGSSCCVLSKKLGIWNFGGNWRRGGGVNGGDGDFAGKREGERWAPLPPLKFPEFGIRIWGGGRVHRLWWDAAFHGSVTGYDGIVRLLSLLPDGWREWATMVADKYIITAYPAYDLVGDFPRFLLAVFTRFVCYGSVSPLLIDSPAPEAEREAQEAARKGKAPAADLEEDEEEDPPVVAPVGSSRLQAITVPSSYSHIRSATEADHPDMGRRMVRVDDIWPHLRKAGNEAVPPALAEESREDPHLLWEWACGEDENNPILVNSEEERVPKRERSPDSDSDSDSDDIRDCGYYTPSGKWDPVRVLDATGCMEAPARHGLIPVSTAGELDILLRTVQARTQGQEQDLTRQLSARNCAQ
ncbi:hypothetical protein SASPL_143793 [Salvia splendens]|uniref:Uncharacterized protein n=1 Tax=Salvia splendens TaxID=180675 RepID=A0A8X8WP14_SALSN|nr:hypothetical protein SASPL_143793 [Salvia splendens]